MMLCTTISTPRHIDVNTHKSNNITIKMVHQPKEKKRGTKKEEDEREKKVGDGDGNMSMELWG